MAVARSPLFIRHQQRLLQLAQDLGIITDDSLAAHLRGLGEGCDRSRITYYRQGDRTAPLGLLPPLLTHLGREGARVLLQALAEPHDLQVEFVAAGSRTLEQEVADVLRSTGRVVSAIADAQDPDGEEGERISAAEARRMLELLDDAEREIGEARQRLRERARIRAVRR